MNVGGLEKTLVGGGIGFGFAYAAGWVTGYSLLYTTYKGASAVYTGISTLAGAVLPHLFSRGKK